MSYSSVCQEGLHSCLEPLLIEPRVLKLKLAPPGANTATIINDAHDGTKSEPGGSFWSFLQSLPNVSHCNYNKAENVYVHHPAVNVKCFSSSSMLGAKSLELCTESLGCETGSYKNASDYDSTDDVSLFSCECSSSSRFMRNTNTQVVNENSAGSKRLNRGNNFPPPLTSITELGGFQFRSHREDGRLILEAVTSFSPQLYFQAERGNGRLRLQMFESVAFCCDEGEGETCEQEACGEEEELEECVIRNGEDEMGMTKFARPSTCKESGNRDIFGDGYIELPSLSLCL